MNNDNLTQEVTILKTWKGEKFEIDMKYEDFLVMEREAKSRWEDWFNSSKYRRFIKFSSIEDKIWKTKYLALEAPKEEFREKTPEESQKIAETIETAMKKTEEWRKKRFYERRNEILEDLARTERMFWMETTIEKLEKYNKLKIKINASD